MARPRTPTAVLESRGAFVKHPERKRQREGEPEPSGPMSQPPSHLSAAEKKVWNELAGKLAPGVAGNSDETAFEVLVCLVANYRKRNRLGLPCVVGELSAMNQLFGRFAMTPVDRGKVKVDVGKKPPKADPLSEFTTLQ